MGVYNPEEAEYAVAQIKKILEYLKRDEQQRSINEKSRRVKCNNFSWT